MWTRAFAVLAAAAAVLLTGAWASAQSCVSDADCSAGQLCLYPPCAPPCDPDDPECVPTECDGMCVEDTGPSFEECTSDDDCENDWICEVVGNMACGDVVCPDGVECPDPQPCESGDITACVPPPPAPCTEDADCDEGLVCVTYSYSDCPPAMGRDCPPGSECPEPEPVDCEDVSESYCVPPYFAPCEADADCGEGFQCVEGEMCGCSGGGSTGVDPGMGGGGTGTGDGGGEGSGTTEPDCVCEPTGELYCELADMPCADDTDCPDGFACELMPAPTVPCTYDAETGETICDDPTGGGGSEGQCVPADWQSWVGGGPAPNSAEDYDGSVGAAVGGDAQAEGRSSEIENPTGEGGGGNVQPGGGNGGSGSSAGGCQVAGGSTGLGQAFLVGLALVVAGWRPRRRSRA